MIKSGQSDSSGDLAKLHGSPLAMAAWQSAQQFLRNHRYAPAVAAYKKLVQQFPGVAKLWGGLGTAAAGDLDFALADEAFQRAMELAFGDVEMLLTLGLQYYRLGRFDQALACHQRAVTTNPASVNARLTLASWFERCRRLDDAWESVQVCLGQHPNDPRALYFKAFLLHRKEMNAEAEKELRDLLRDDSSVPLDVKADANHLLGVVLDALEQYRAALDCLGKSKTLRRQITNVALMEQAYDKVNEDRRKVIAAMTPETLRRWRDDAAASPSPYPLVLLGGAPRSGTTLIEQILGAHPDVLIFDEPQAFAQEIFPQLHPLPPAKGLTLASLNALTAQVRSHLIGRYFKSVLRETPDGPGAKVLLDKNPSTTMSLPIWLRLFPQSKIAIALRDPRDVVISCYFQNIQLGWANVSFLSLERTARYYADCMDIWLRMRELGGFGWIETRYEDIVGNLETEGRRVTGFLGVSWDQAQAKFHETAGRRVLNSPTYGEVTKPIYKKAMGRWEHYAEALAPLQGKLEPYLRTFGYGS